MHLVNRARIISAARQERLKIVDYGSKRHDISQTNGWGRFHTIGLVLLETGVPQCYFLLIVEPVLVIRPQASIQYPLFKP